MQQHIEQALQQQVENLSKIQEYHTWALELAPELTATLEVYKDLFKGLHRVEVDREDRRLRFCIYNDAAGRGVSLTFEPFKKCIRQSISFWYPTHATGYGGPTDLHTHSREAFRALVLDSLKSYLNFK